MFCIKMTHVLMHFPMQTYQHISLKKTLHTCYGKYKHWRNRVSRIVNFLKVGSYSSHEEQKSVKLLYFLKLGCLRRSLINGRISFIQAKMKNRLHSITCLLHLVNGGHLADNNALSWGKAVLLRLKCHWNALQMSNCQKVGVGLGRGLIRH